MREAILNYLNKTTAGDSLFNIALAIGMSQEAVQNELYTMMASRLVTTRVETFNDAGEGRVIYSGVPVVAATTAKPGSNIPAWLLPIIIPAHVVGAIWHLLKWGAIIGWRAGHNTAHRMVCNDVGCPYGH